ncbi:hypothetical protein MycrhDRAFT_2519 [Mycolicibacterium rhodesiae JS60]|nr:hypothetical protein MycrhDRAFT_2519 [Mycolicibacterium rhodesiae JS60]
MYPIAEGPCTASALLTLPRYLAKFVELVSGSRANWDLLYPKHFRQPDPFRYWR